MWGPCKMTGTYCCRHLMEVISLQMKHNIRPVHLLNVSFFESMWYDMEFTIYPQICLFISKDGQHCWIWKALYGSDFSLCQLYLSTAVAAPALEYGTRANAWHNEPAVHVKMGFLNKKAWQKRHNLCFFNLCYCVCMSTVSSFWLQEDTQTKSRVTISNSVKFPLRSFFKPKSATDE